MKVTASLVILDVALREAVIEQLGLAKTGAVKDYADIPAALAAETPALFLIDEAALDKKALNALRAHNDKTFSVLLLGVPPSEAELSCIAESFPKPVRLGHLLARIKFYLETAPRLRVTPVNFGAYRLEPHNRRIVAPVGVIHLTEKETALLTYLGQSAKPVARDELLAAIWGYDARIDTHTLETHIYQLRRKLDPTGNSPDFLINENGTYRLNFGS